MREGVTETETERQRDDEGGRERDWEGGKETDSRQAET